MISPPGSPTQGWVQIEEDPPNLVTLHEDIQEALDRLAEELGQNGDDKVDEPKSKIILDTTDQGGVQVFVHDCDSTANSGNGIDLNAIHEITIPGKIGNTPRPPVDSESE